MRKRIALSILVGAVAALFAQSASAPLYLSATLANVAGAPDAVRVEILRWSSDQERDALLNAWSLKPAPGAAKGRGAAKAGKAGAKGAPQGEPPPAAVLVPEVELAKALQEAATVGYLWTSELSGYALRYAGQVSAADGSQRVVLITQRRLGAMNQRWVPSTGVANNLEFSVIELRLNAKGRGEGKVSLIGKLKADTTAKIVVPESYESLPVVFRDVKPAAKQP